ncbi:hypothetical protein HDU76_007871, partial [Blyttiomyces sp. JEL0837]
MNYIRSNNKGSTSSQTRTASTSQKCIESSSKDRSIMKRTTTSPVLLNIKDLPFETLVNIFWYLQINPQNSTIGISSIQTSLGTNPKLNH